MHFCVGLFVESTPWPIHLKVVKIRILFWIERG